MIRKLARPMLASVFVWEGVDNLRNASEHVKETEGFLKTCLLYTSPSPRD